MTDLCNSSEGAPLLSALTGDPEIAACFSPAAEIEALLHFEIALAQAEAGIALIEAEAAGVIARALVDFRPDFDELRRGLRIDGVVVPELVRQIRRAVGEPHGDAVHFGATSQDAIDTGFMLRVRQVLVVLQARLEKLSFRLAELVTDQGHQPLMARTRMQSALPFDVAAKIATWERPLASHRRRLAGLRGKLAIQLGGPIGDGSSFGGRAAEVRAGLAARLDLAAAEPWHTDRSAILDVAQGLALLTGTLGKAGQDIALMAMENTIRLRGGGGSSAMPHKQNPVGAELLVTFARLNAGLMGTLHQSMVHENERSGAAWTLEWIVLPQMFETAGAAVVQAERLLDGARFG